MRLDDLTPAQFVTFRTISIAQTRNSGKAVNPLGLRGVRARCLDRLVEGGWLMWSHGVRLLVKARARGAEQRWLKTRHDTEHEFVCSRCRRHTDARDGGGTSDVDPNGDYCSTCYADESHNIQRGRVGFPGRAPSLY